ncbi:MAG: proline--tRNA ligase [Myxococcota bacterium]|nr:proline--tRNA ligase [Myxococcota bacterium]
MRATRYHLPTLKEVPAEAQMSSHVFLIRGGFIRKLAAGIYDYLPLGYKAIRKVEEIVRQEMARAGALEVLLPSLIPAELWIESGRWEKYGPELLRLQDRKASEFCFGPTHEEVIVDLVRRDVRTYRELPRNLFQIQTKFRDEMRPRAGLIRGREFIMKDAYSFDADLAGAQRSYQDMYRAYGRIFARCGLDFRPVEAATGNIGGSSSHEFQVLTDSGEDRIVSCSHCGYAANVEMAELDLPDLPPVDPAAFLPREPVATPGKKTIEEVSTFLGVSPQQTAKLLVYLADGQPVAALLRGDRELNEAKLQSATGASQLVAATDAAILEVTGQPCGFLTPVGLPLPLYVDREVAGTANLVAGGGAVDLHERNVNYGRDFAATRVLDLRVAAAGDRCPRCREGSYQEFKGIEVGHVFLLGTRYSAPMGCSYLDEQGQDQPMVMGCYGIGITRIVSAAIEQNCDANGICWPVTLAPFQVELLPVGKPGDVTYQEAARLHDLLQEAGVDVLLDDRPERAGSKFKDADLWGIPVRVTLGGRSVEEGVAEVGLRRDLGATRKVPLGEVVAHVQELLGAELALIEGRVASWDRLVAG